MTPAPSRPWRARRLNELPPYLFVEIDRKKALARAAGRELIDFGVGDPDQPTPDFIIRNAQTALTEPANHRYPTGRGTETFLAAAADYFFRRFGVRLDVDSQILALIGSKEGLAHLPLAVVDPGDVVLVPTPAYPVYEAGARFAGANCEPVPLREDRGWLPDFDALKPGLLNRARLLFLNYPNNPTSATCSLDWFARAVEFARRYDLLIAHDAAYAEVYFDDPPPSILQIDGAIDCCVEFHSLSKTFNMTGWRIGFAAGNVSAIAGLAVVKNNVDSGPFPVVQAAAAAALRGFDGEKAARIREPYRRRRDVLTGGLVRAGWSVMIPRASFYAWARCPEGWDSLSTAERILDEAFVVVIPGVGFGRGGEGYIRFALTVDEARTQEGVERIAALTW